MSDEKTTPSKEILVRPFSGYAMLAIAVALVMFGVFVVFKTVSDSANYNMFGGSVWLRVVLIGAPFIIAAIILPGLFTLQPNEARVLILFGKYHGTVRSSGFHWANPFYANGPAISTDSPTKFKYNRYKISLRTRNFNCDKLKVNDKRGNPIEIAAVIVWRVENTAQATFDVDNYENYIRVQSESALRHLANSFAYDHGEENEFTLRSSADEVAHALREQLQERLSKAGVFVEEARLTHLAYAPEIAQAMLRRQQAEAVIAARQKIVQGAVSMVEMALKEFSEKKLLVLDDERKAAMVSNLMVVLCGESEVHPVVNTGTLYS